MTKSIFLNLFLLSGGLAIFLYGMQQGEKNLKNFSTKRIKNIVTFITKHRILAFIAGIVITLLTQSSSATTVMLVGLASANLLTLHQSLGMILGADLGTTVTVQLFAFKFQQLAPLLIALGYFATLKKSNEAVRKTGSLILAFGFIFFGMSLMSDGISDLRSLPSVTNGISASLANPILGLLAGTLFTAIVQSSAATLSILITISTGYVLNSGEPAHLSNFIPIIFGANMGTCATAFLSTFNANTEGKRVAWAHFIFKLCGTIILMPFIKPITHLIGDPTTDLPLYIAGSHTVFNLIIAFIFLPFIQSFSKGINKLVKRKSRKEERFEVHYLHSDATKLPVLAIAQSTREITRMSERVVSMYEKSLNLFTSYSNEQALIVTNKDDEVDFLHEEILRYLTQLSQQELDDEISKKSYKLIMVTTELEHIGDVISKSIVPLAHKLNEHTIDIPAKEMHEFQDFWNESLELFRNAMAAFTMNNESIAQEVYERKKVFRAKFETLTEVHLNRLYSDPAHTTKQSAIYVDLLEEVMRINMFIYRIAAHELKILNAE